MNAARDDRPGPVLLWDGVAVPGALCAELAGALDTLEAFLRGTPPPASCRVPRLSRGVFAVREAARAAAVLDVERQERASRLAFAAASAPQVTVLTPAIARRESAPEEITTLQAAMLAGVSEARVRQLAAAGTITGRKADRNVWLLDPESVRAYRDRRGSRHGHDDGNGHQRAARQGAA